MLLAAGGGQGGSQSGHCFGGIHELHHGIPLALHESLAGLGRHGDGEAGGGAAQGHAFQVNRPLGIRGGCGDFHGAEQVLEAGAYAGQADAAAVAEEDFCKGAGTL